MYSLKDTMTAQNLAKAFAGECQARMRYLLYAETADAANLPVIKNIFLETADQERGHAEVFYDYLSGQLNGVILTQPVGVPVYKGNTAFNLEAAANGENSEWTKLYPDFGNIAKREGFDQIAQSFFAIASIEKRHNEQFGELLKRYSSGKLFKNDTPAVWECTNCGYRLKDYAAPAHCPACRHPQVFYRML